MDTHHFNYGDKTFGVRVYNRHVNRLEIYQWKPEETPKKCREKYLIAEYFGNTGYFEFHNKPDFSALCDLLKHVARGNVVGRDSVSGCGQKLAGELSDIVTKELEFRQRVEANHQLKNGQKQEQEQEPIWNQ